MEFILYENSGRIHEKSIYTRDNNGNALSGKKENSKRQVKSSWEYFYNSKDELLEIKTYNLKGELSYRQLNVFDTKGNQIKMILENIKQNSSRETTYKYNSNGEKTEQINFNPDKSFKDKRTYKYDSRGNEIEQVLVQSDSSYIRFDSKYDEYNNLIIQKWYNKKGEQTQETSYLYVYDDYGNWITKKRLSKNVLNMVWERKLKYY